MMTVAPGCFTQSLWDSWCKKAWQLITVMDVLKHPKPGHRAPASLEDVQEIPEGTTS